MRYVKFVNFFCSYASTPDITVIFYQQLVNQPSLRPLANGTHTTTVPWAQKFAHPQHAYFETGYRGG